MLSSGGIAFIAAIAASVGIELWLAHRQVHTVQAHRNSVPPAFTGSMSLGQHRKAADYTIARVRLQRLETLLAALLTLVLTVGGGIAVIDALWRRTGWEQPWLGLAVIATVAFALAALNLPLALWRTFRLEAHFGFNRTTPVLFLADLGKSLLLAVLLGGPLVLLVLFVMQHAGRWWWVWFWGVWLAVSLLISWAWPAFIAPLFNRFSPLADDSLRARLEALLARCGFSSSGVFVIDGSRRSSHGNAYFTGLGRHKRIVFFDTLLQQLQGAEIEAVLAHELGHFRLGHIRQRLLVSGMVALVSLAAFDWLAARPEFYRTLGVPLASAHAALLLLVLVGPVLLFFISPLSALWSRLHEFSADRFAAAHASAADLATALAKLYRDNANTLTPDPWYVAFYYSHPPALERIRRLDGAR
ncbi:MAG TPA: M48 family metallopeptidase [Steroidobacteraceae bacterium]|jgi:STE24 endopeptidase|nr:M48 family metallopeptidase [Steroidobacteraceae bacterium]